MDDTNLHEKHLTRLKSLAEEVALSADRKIIVEERFFEVSLKEAIDRDSKRGKKSVGRRVITDMYYKYLAAGKKEREYTPGLPEVVIVDIDGTIADSVGIRSPYDHAKYSLDRPIEKVIRLVKLLAEKYKVIFVSGREDIGNARMDTMTWLMKNVGLPETHLIQRAYGDHRKDFVVKKEIYERDIFPKYNVYLVLDDRSTVVNTLREELGLTVLQCAPGDF